MTKLAPETKVPTAALAGTGPKHGGVTGWVAAQAAGVHERENCSALGSENSGASAVVAMAVGFLSSESFWDLQSRSLGSAMVNTAGSSEVMFAGRVRWL